jgi:superfamily I DNA/RNA helicase
MSDIKFSDEQINIFNYASKGILNIIVQAVAGAGKTTTLVECVKHIDSNKSILLLAHNKSTRDTLKERIGDRDNVRVYTLHGLAWRMFTEHFDKTPDIDDDKYRNYVNKNINEICSDEYAALTPSLKLLYKSNVFDLIDKARQNLKQSEKEIRKLATRKYGMALVADEPLFVANVLKWGMENIDTVDYCDLLYFPSEFGYFTKRYLADIIMLDEAQDASIAQQDVISRCFMRNTRLFAFGDRDQTINSWCGSDTESFDHLKDASVFRRDAKEFPLTTNYRCGKKIIEYAKRFTSNNIHARENAQDGEVNFEASLNDAKDGDMILCRNIAPLMSVYRKGVSSGKKMYFRGEELGKSLIKAVDCSNGYTIKEIIESMKNTLVATWDFLTIDQNLDPRETMTDRRVISLFETIKTMECLPKTVENRDDLYKFVKDVFSEEGREGIQLSTIHRAKGLEADNVFIICPSLVPSGLATLDWQIDEEKHLQYVMCTRPKNTLNFVSEKEVRTNNVFAEANAFYSELLKIKDEVYVSKKK